MNEQQLRHRRAEARRAMVFGEDMRHQTLEERGADTLTNVGISLAVVSVVFAGVYILGNVVDLLGRLSVA